MEKGLDQRGRARWYKLIGGRFRLSMDGKSLNDNEQKGVFWSKVEGKRTRAAFF